MPRLSSAQREHRAAVTITYPFDQHHLQASAPRSRSQEGKGSRGWAPGTGQRRGRGCCLGWRWDVGGPPGAGVVPTWETEGRLCPKSGTTPLLGGAAPGRVSTCGREHQRSLALPRNAHAGPTLRGLTSGSPGAGPAAPGTAASLRPDSASTASPPQFPWLRAGEGGPSSSLGFPLVPSGFLSAHADGPWVPVIPAMGARSGNLCAPWGPSTRGPVGT